MSIYEDIKTGLKQAIAYEKGEVAEADVNKLWDELIIDHFYCKHKECLYKDCMYHMYSTKPNYFSDEDIPFYMPRTNEEMKSCTSYMNIYK